MNPSSSDIPIVFSTDIRPLTLDEAQAVLSPHLQKVARCFMGAWQKWLVLHTQFPEFTRPLTPRAIANVVSDYIWDFVKTEFADIPGAYTSDAKSLRLLCINDEVTLRFKKLNNNYQSSNIPTTQQVAFVQHSFISGIPTAPRLTAGYVLNSLQSEIQALAVTMPQGKQVLWSMPIPLTEEDINVTPLVLSASEERTRKVVVKDAAKVKQREGNE